MIRKSTIIVAVILVLTFALAASAQNEPVGPQGGGGDRPGMHQGLPPGAFASLGRILMPPAPRELAKMGMAMNLSEDQKASIKALYKTFHDVLKQVAPDRAANLKAAIGVMQQASPSKDALLAANTKIQQNDNIILSAEFDFWVALRGILSQQQQAAAQGFLQQRMQTEMTGGGPRQGGPRGPGAPK